MAKIVLNGNYVDTGDVKQTGKYLFVAEEGTPAVELSVWLEKSKANEAHPDGKPWIILPKDNPTNRKYFSEDLFIASQVDGEVEVEVKTTPPRVLGASGVKQEIVKYLDEQDAAEYSYIVENAIAAFKTARAEAGKKKPEDMSVEELQAYIDALKEGKPAPSTTGPKSFLDMLTDYEYDRYNELLALSQENKANAPKAQRRPLTEAEKQVRAKKRAEKELSKAEALLAEMLASK